VPRPTPIFAPSAQQTHAERAVDDDSPNDPPIIHKVAERPLIPIIFIFKYQIINCVLQKLIRRNLKTLDLDIFGMTWEYLGEYG
jgi:hypothetical protein